MTDSLRRVVTAVRARVGRKHSVPAPVRDPRFTAAITPREPSHAPGPRIVLINDCRDQISFGSNALADGLLGILTDAAPNATVVPIPSHWLIDAVGSPSGFLADGAGMVQPLAAFPQVADQFETIADDWEMGAGGPGVSEYLDRFTGADVVVLNGEGSIYRTNMSAVRELFLAWYAKVHLGLPTVFVNGSVHLTGVVPVLPAMVRKTFRELDAIAVREPRSLQNLAEHVPGLAARVIADAAFVFSRDDARETDAVRALRTSLGASAYFCFDPGAMPVDVRGGEKSAVFQLIEALRPLGTPVFVSNMPADDYIAEMAEATGSVFVDTIRDYREFLAVLADAQFLVSGRHHNLILASTVGCPTVALGTVTHKVHGACDMLEGIVGSPYDGTDLRPAIGTIAQQGRRYVEERDTIRERLLDVSARRRAEALEMGHLVLAAAQSQLTA